MKLLSGLAQRIVNEVTHILAEEVIVVDHTGIIIAGSDHNRVGSFHEGALIAVKNKGKIVISKEDVNHLRGVKAGINLPIIFHNKAIGVIGITGEPSKVNQFGELIQRMTELIIQEAHSHEKLESKYRGLETYVYEWLHLQHIDEDFRERGEILGISMDIPRCCALLEIAQLENKMQENQMIEREAIEILREFFPGDSQDVLVQWGSGRFVLLKAITSTNLEDSVIAPLKIAQRTIKEVYGISLNIGIGTRVEVPEKLHCTYNHAKKALRVAKKSGSFINYDDLTLDVALAEITDETRKEVVDKVLGILLKEVELLETLEAYLESNLSIKETSKQLHIHINTLHYRLKRIYELTGYSLKETENLVMYYIALSFWKEVR
ncbi:helix-turn-helix domain-containing protein [Anaerobacillus sp. CMMVII]|uniref:CdaR family transcriptional regulator n=1 Tax=Anaerobacillus sp. CMMVII TaxID=2755588 RepID=UPI0021B80470|nr:sugar diacid recognition domain-containing protein [Anaerobacillus sp. CMMVII]MCT8139634.1 helix-turn-helix domain-containing protein [Anaerobacillus sp. CMMVII]